MTTNNETWDLESVFPGGSQSTELADFLTTLTGDIKEAETAALPPALSEQNEPEWISAIQKTYGLTERLQHVGSHIACLNAQNVKDVQARQLNKQVAGLQGGLGTVWTRLGAHMAEQDNGAWESLLTTADLSGVAFHLTETRHQALLKMDVPRETLVTELGTDGYHAWSRLYFYMAGDKSVQFDEQKLSLGQLQSTFMDAPDRETRKAAFDVFEKAWGELAEPSSMALNNLAGFRLTTYKHRSWESFLQEPLQQNRLTADTLFTMWDVIDRKADKLKDFFAAKAKLIGVDQLAWYDTWSPVGEGKQSYSYAQAADLVVEKTNSINPDIAEFCRHAIDSQWIEAENRSGKQAGAYCTGLPLLKEPRIFMTYNGSFSGLLTLAHELGHGYHSWVMRDLPVGARRYTMSVAETASTLNELLVKNAVMESISDKQEKINILGTSLNDAASYLMNIRSRFEFEKNFYSARTSQQLSVAELSAMMEDAQKMAYKGALSQYHPLFWASKLHFYGTRVPFYNFPYTFGFLFSNGVYSYAAAEGKDFVSGYKAMLRDTGRMTTEQLASKHLGVDLTKPEFWETAVDRVLGDVDKFVALVG